MNISINRLKKEHANYQNKEEIAKIEEQFNCKLKLFLRGEGLYNWYAKFTGPKGSPYESGSFLIQIDVSTEYPIKPPKCTFVTKIFHPNVHLDTGEICHELLKDKWSPSCSLETVCKSILDVMNYPNGESPLNCDAGNLIRSNDLVGFYFIAKMFTEDFALKEF